MYSVFYGKHSHLCFLLLFHLTTYSSGFAASSCQKSIYLIGSFSVLNFKRHFQWRSGTLPPANVKAFLEKKEQHFYDHRGVEDEFHFVSRGVWYLEKKKTSGKEHISDLDTLCLNSMKSLEGWQDTIGQYSGDMGLRLSPWGMGLPGVTEDFHFGIIYGKCMEYTGQKTISFIHFRTVWWIAPFETLSSWIFMLFFVMWSSMLLLLSNKLQASVFTLFKYMCIWAGHGTFTSCILLIVFTWRVVFLPIF